LDNDVGLEPGGAQVGEQFDRRLIYTLGVGPVEARMLRGGNPVLDDLLELCGGHAGV